MILMETKKCKTCGEEKEVSKFMPMKMWCRDCWNEKRRLDRLKKKEEYEQQIQNSDELITKTCTGCNEDKPIDKFSVGFSRCKECINTQDRERERKKKPQKEILISEKEGHKICPYCKEELPDEMFRKNRIKCLNCERSDGRQYRKSDHGKEKSKKWVNENQKQMQKLQADWYQDNKQKVRDKYVERYHNDDNFRIKKTSAKSVIESMNLLKKNKTRQCKYLGCTNKEFGKWLEYCYEDGMSLDNHGKYWHMDHVIPVDKFDLTDADQVMLCFNWKNVMPMTGKDNMNKKANVNREQLKRHLDNLNGFVNSIDYEEFENDKINMNQYTQLCATHLVTGKPLRL
jgi:hypothetical protein